MTRWAAHGLMGLVLAVCGGQLEVGLARRTGEPPPSWLAWAVGIACVWSATLSLLFLAVAAVSAVIYLRRRAQLDADAAQAFWDWEARQPWHQR